VLPIAALSAFLVTLLFLGALLSAFGRRLVLDHPNERSLHESPVPRTGGLAIVGGVAIAWAIVRPGFEVALGLAGALAAMSLLDDVFSLPTLLRLCAHLAVATIAIALELQFPGWPVAIAFVFGVAWYTNLYNFMDGSDGLAGGMAVIGFGAYAIAAHLAGAPGLAAVCGMLSAAAAAFLTKNYPPARIFLGDVGSVPLGFLAGVLGLVGWNKGLWPMWFPLLVFAPFVCDATLTLLRRMMRRERIWQAHREHYYQRLVRSGLGHRGTLFVEYAAMLACASAAIGVRNAPVGAQFVVLAGAAIVLAAIAVWVDLRWARFLRNSGNVG
jgi:UDP-N-acetylmuramyl pentapeptide phosphotransferase/UDP-N-acetylglucosamine-1-phosphate transferase